VTPAYLALSQTGELTLRARTARERLRCCRLCPRGCGVDRLAGTDGARCRTGDQAVVDGFGAHFGEEDCLRGTRGSGTVFFSRCNLGCVFCQNWPISHGGRGQPVEPGDIAVMMLTLQEQGCHNINLVSPSHVAAPILAAIAIAAHAGLRLPIVYNSGGYDSVDTLRLFDGVVDIYMPDAKYGDTHTAERLSQGPGYVEANRAAIREMHRQVGDLVLNDDGIAERGLLVRHLVLPEDLAGSARVFDFLATEISRHTFVNVMGQYHPSHLARVYPPLDRRVTVREVRQALALARQHGLRLPNERRR